MGLLDGKIAVITGGAQGIGLAIAHRFHSEGARIVLGDLDLDATRAAAGSLSADSLAIRCDVTRSADVEALIAGAVDAFGSIDIMINNAGITRDATMRTSPVEIRCSCLAFGAQL